MAVSLLLLFDGFNQSLGNAVEGNGIDGGLGGKYSSHSIGQHLGVIGSKDARHVVGGWRVRRGATGGFIGHMGIRHGGRGVEDVKDDTADMQAEFIGGTRRGIPCRRRGV